MIRVLTTPHVCPQHPMYVCSKHTMCSAHDTITAHHECSQHTVCPINPPCNVHERLSLSKKSNRKQQRWSERSWQARPAFVNQSRFNNVVSSHGRRKGSCLARPSMAYSESVRRSDRQLVRQPARPSAAPQTEAALTCMVDGGGVNTARAMSVSPGLR